MTTTAILIHAASAAIFTLGMVITLLVGTEVNSGHVAATVALLGLNVAVHYLRCALDADGERVERRDRPTAPETPPELAEAERAIAQAGSPRIEWRDE